MKPRGQKRPGYLSSRCIPPQSTAPRSPWRARGHTQPTINPASHSGGSRGAGAQHSNANPNAIRPQPRHNAISAGANQKANRAMVHSFMGSL